MKIVAVSDLHGFLPEVPQCDLLLLGGDYHPSIRMSYSESKLWYDGNFRFWLEDIYNRGIKVVGVAGNHDFYFERKDYKKVYPFKWEYLQDSGFEFKGVKIWGSPWQPEFGNWAFNGDEGFLKTRWAMIPSGIDILLLHGPPHGILDYSFFGGENTGSQSLRNEILDRIKPKAVVFGHIHECFGDVLIDGITFANVSYVDEFYTPRNGFTEIYLP